MAWNEPGNKGNNDDPWGGGRGGGGRGNGDQGPPDLDEVIKNLTNKFNGLFGKKGGGAQGGGSSSSSGAAPAGLLAALLVVVVIAWAAMGFYTLDESERGVVFRFGEIRDEIVMPGLRWRPPLIDTVEKINVTGVRTRSYTNDMLTTDENIVNVSMSVQYIVEDPVKFAIEVRDPERSLDHATESAIRHVAGGTTMDRLLTQGRAVAAAEVSERLQNYLTSYGTGIRVVQVNVENAQPPNAVQPAFDDVIRAREDEQRAQNRALAYANRVIPEARGEAQRIIEQANAYRDQVVAQSEGETYRFEQLLAEYQRAPEVTRERLYIDAIEDVLANSSKILVDIEGGNNMLYLPLDRMMQQGSGTTTTRNLQLTPQQLRELTDQVSREISLPADRARVQPNNTGRGGR